MQSVLKFKNILLVGVMIGSGLACSKDPEFVDGGFRDGSNGADGAVLDDAAAPQDAALLEDAGATDTAGKDSGPPLTEQEQSLIDMPADSWLRVSAGYIDRCEAKYEDDWYAVSGCSALLSAWNSGVWAAGPRLFLLWGGGHNDYAGNEVYAFSARDFTWERLTEPSPGPYDQDPLPDGQPVSRHTYDGLAWMSHRGEMYGWGGSRSKDGNPTKVTWQFDPLARSWQQVETTGVPNGSYENSAVYDEVTRTIYLKVTQNFYAYDIEQATYRLIDDLGYPPLWPRYAGHKATGTLDSERRQLWYVGGGGYMIYDIDRAVYVTDDWITTGGSTFDNSASVPGRPDQQIQTGGGEVIQAGAPGLAYDSKADQMVAWVGGGPWVLDLASKVWTQRSAVDAPASPVPTGTYGRFRYLPEYNVFALVTTTDAVYFYKNSAGP